MNTGVHLGYAWLLGNTTEFTLNERRAVTISGVAADFDSLAIIFGREAFNEYHHVVFHNLIFVAVIMVGAFLLFPGRKKLLLFCTLAGLLHLACDFVGSHWDLELFRPFSGAAVNLTNHLPKWVVMYVFQGAGTAGMFALVLWVFLRKGRSFFEIFTPKGDRLVMKFLTLPWRHRCGECTRRAFYQCSGCGAYLCPRHRKAAPGWRLLCGKCLEEDAKGTLPEREVSASEGSQ